MLTSSVIEGSNIVTMTYDGPLRAEELVAARERLRTVIRERGSARLLVEYGAVDLGRVEPRAMWEDLRTSGVLLDLTKVAVVADRGWIDTLAAMTGTVLPVEVRSFLRAQRDNAVAWLYS
jgi:SpoIIAA-like